jgi:hypothetical protein
LEDSLGYIARPCLTEKKKMLALNGYIIPGYMSQGIQGNIQSKYLYTHDYNSTSHNNQNMESDEVTINL